MNIGVLTFHHADNFGAVWQCYSMCLALQRLGHQPFVVNYRPTDALLVYRMPKGRFCITPKMIAYFKKRLVFNRFRRSHLPPQSRLHTSGRSLRNSPPAADAFIAGSDQIWNPDLFLSGSYDPAYFLDFAGGARRVAYAASFGESRPLDLTNSLREMLARFDSIGVREETAAHRLASEFGLDVRVTCDPVLLTEDYSRFFAHHKIDGDFAFCYNLFNRSSTDEVCVRLAEAKGCEVRRVNDDWRFWKHSTKQEFGIGPIRWLNLVNQSHFVISDSFHATVFSVILGKKFLALLANREKGGANRIVGFLDHVGLSSRIIREGETPSEIQRRLDEPIDWQDVRIRINNLRRSSLAFLEEALAS